MARRPTRATLPEALVEHPSAAFYGGVLRCDPAAPAASPPPLGFPWPGLPLAFLDTGREAETKHAGGGVSNAMEAAVVAGLVDRFLAAGLGPADVVVITPYSRQVDAIRRELDADVRVGTVDSFQGQEADVVIFSSVRSNENGDLGFLRDPRRLNVALTRARRGLVLVGCATTLRHSRHWAALVASCGDRGCVLDARDFVDDDPDAAAAPLAALAD